MLAGEQRRRLRLEGLGAKYVAGDEVGPNPKATTASPDSLTMKQVESA
jgi:hypothetical protein